MGGGHGVGEGNLRWRFKGSREGDRVCKDGGEMAVAMRNGGCGEKWLRVWPKSLIYSNSGRRGT
jgi:hypothetical protein